MFVNKAREFIRSARSSLAGKFVLLTAGVTLTVLLITGALTYYLERETEFARLRAKSQMLAEFVSSISPDRIFAHDLGSLHEFVKKLNDFPDVSYAVILDNQGVPMTAYLNHNNPDIANAVRAVGGADVLKVSRHLNTREDIAVFSSPILFGDREIGSVRIGVTRRHAEASMHRALLLYGTAILTAIFCLGLGIYYVFHRHVLRPTQHLIEGAGRVARGDLDGRIPLDSRDELGQVARSFNEMTTHLARSNREREQALNDLRELNRTLEIRVEERTRAIEEINRQLERQVLYDPLTDLPNRTLLQDRLDQMLRVSERTGNHFAVAILDLDGFKEINDTLGHHVGDELLKNVGRRLSGILRDTDTVARLGGDEFALLLPGNPDEDVVCVANKILKALEQPVPLEGMSCSVSASLGIARFPENGPDSTTLLRHADIAMYEAKQSKTGYCLYHRDIDTHSPRRLELMAELRSAVESGGLRLFYQPIIDVTGGQAWRGVEALARWPHPERGFVPPDMFIPLIEKTGLVRAFSHWVLDTALAQWADWRAKGVDLVMSVNLSMHNLQDKEFPGQLASLLDKWAVRPHALMLEITEGGVMNVPERVLETLDRFRGLGVDVAIDDFGTGYSSLSYLKRLPVHEIKIDRSFIKDMAHDTDDAVIVRSTIEMAHNLGLKVVAEGVEDARTLDMLRGLDCDLAQGDYFSQPLTVADLKFPAAPVRPLAGSA